MPLLALLLVAASGPAAPPLPATIDLTRPFATRTPWRLAATQGPTIPDPILGDGTVPGAVRLCLGHPGGTCQPDVARLLTPPGGADAYAEPHALLAAHAGTIMGVETNAMQFYPEASRLEATVHPGLYQRRGGEVDLSTLGGSGFGYRLKED